MWLFDPSTVRWSRAAVSDSMCGLRGDRARAGGRSLGRHYYPPTAIGWLSEAYVDATLKEPVVIVPSTESGIGGDQWSRAGSNHAGPPGRARSSRRPLDHKGRSATLNGEVQVAPTPIGQHSTLCSRPFFSSCVPESGTLDGKGHAARPTRTGADFRSAKPVTHAPSVMIPPTTVSRCGR